MKNLAFAVILVCGPALAAHAADAKTTWADKCAKCHGAEGKGDTKMGKKLGIKDYSDASVQAGFTDEQAFKALKEGIKDKAGSTRMKAVEDMSDGDINDLVAYVRGLKK
jgi:cytochrome c553